jgi:hypothetical protein
MARTCSTCQHVKRVEIDRRLAGGEPTNQIARDVACLPSKDELSAAYAKLREQIDEVVAQAQQQGSLALAISGLNAIRHTLDSVMRLAGYDRPIVAQVNVAVQNNVQVDLSQVADRLIQQFDHEPDLKARIARALLAIEAAPAVPTDPPALTGPCDGAGNRP